MRVAAQAPRRVVVVIAVAAALVLLAGCRGEPDARDELEQAVRATGDTSMTFTVQTVADPDAAASLQGTVGDATRTARSGSRSRSGVTSRSSRWSRLPGGPLLLRTGLAELLDLVARLQGIPGAEALPGG